MKLLFICTHNRCRSILAEAITNHLAQGIIKAVSAGSSPQGEVHPMSLKALRARNIDTRGLRSQSWDMYQAFKPDAVLTMCDKANAESCPVWFGDSIQVNWSLEDPSKEGKTAADQKIAFEHTISIIERRVKRMLSEKVAELSGSALQEKLRKIGTEIN